MSSYDIKAAKLQRDVRVDEYNLDSNFGDNDVRRAIIHTREDVVLMVSHLSSINSQLRVVRWLLVILLAIFLNH